MKKYLSLILCLCMILTMASCASKDKKSDETETSQNSGAISDRVAEGSVIDGMMTDIATDDPILQRSTASWADTCVLYEVNIRQFTEEGTFKAFEGHLDRLKDMGINTLWLMPIHPISETGRKGSLGSYYAVSDYKAVNPEFGTMEDFQHLVTTAHEKGFKVILDWVANHTGWDNAWITEHDEWYVHNDNGKIESPYNWSDVAQLDYNNYEMRAEMIRCMQFWIEDMDIDGFRCDHATGVPTPFWNAAVYQLKTVKSDILMLAEASASQSMTSYAFDSCYNDTLYGEALMIQHGVGISSIRNGMEPDYNYAAGSFPMNYLDNHDKNSYERSAEERFKDTYQPLLALTFITPGMPLIYTSDEQGYDHEIEFFEKDTVPWEDEPKYAGLIAALAEIKINNKALASTNTDIAFLESNDSKTIAFSRTSGDNTVIYIANLYYKALSDVSVNVDFDTATCVLHYDGSALDTAETQITNAVFEQKTYSPYEFYILTIG